MESFLFIVNCFIFCIQLRFWSLHLEAQVVFCLFASFQFTSLLWFTESHRFGEVLRLMPEHSPGYSIFGFLGQLTVPASSQNVQTLLMGNTYTSEGKSPGSLLACQMVVLILASFAGSKKPHLASPLFSRFEPNGSRWSCAVSVLSLAS